MRNLVHNIAALEQAFTVRRVELHAEVTGAVLAGRARSIANLAAGRPWYGDRYAPQPRDGRGRYLSQAWLDQAESYTPADTAWFRAPIR